MCQPLKDKPRILQKTYTNTFKIQKKQKHHRLTPTQEKIENLGNTRAIKEIASTIRNFPHRALAGVAQWIECGGPVNQSRRFNFWSGHMPGLWARSPVGGE